MKLIERYYDLNSIAQTLRVNTRTLRRWVDSGKFPVADFRENRTIRWSNELLEKWFRTRKPGEHIQQDEDLFIVSAGKMFLNAHNIDNISKGE
jgi:hypothetical protein